jgi:D-glycero-alpha-D-manno-heptose 1-phosphate guanylyltransferase
MEAIILAGGLGTRLQEAVPELPKCLAPVNGLPFIQYVVNHLIAHQVTKIILALGYRSEQVTEYFNHHPQKVPVIYSNEETPLGTGGAVNLALKHTTKENTVIVNGDTLCRADVLQLAAKHQQYKAVCTLSLKPMKSFNRYGSVTLEQNGRISSFHEKKYCEEGLINTGVYLLNVPYYGKIGFPEKFSFENDFLEKYCSEGIVSGYVQDEYFIDIGIPEDYERAQEEL